MVPRLVGDKSGVEVGDLLLGKYRIVQPIKTGGTAAIYLAIAHGENLFSREVVIKRPLPHLLADPRLRDMFIDEAHVQSRLAHPNIVQVIDLIAQGNEVFLVLEFLNGVDLREINQRCADRGHTVPQHLAAYISAEVCAGLHFAHEVTAPDGRKLNLVHRDVSPKNVRLTDRGAVKLIDFGIAHFENRLTETKEGSIKGTLGYMSPEQIMGEIVDRRVDVFAWGICMFQMLTGRNPFEATNLKERIHKLIHAPVPKVSDFNPTVDARLDAIVDKCLDRDLEQRYTSAEEIGRELGEYVAQAQIASPREQLAAFLSELFPNIEAPPEKLRVALAETSGLGKRTTDVGSEGRTKAESAPPPPTEELRIAPSAAAHRTVPNVPVGSEHATAEVPAPSPDSAGRSGGPSTGTLAAAGLIVAALAGLALWTGTRSGDATVESLSDEPVVVADAGSNNALAGSPTNGTAAGTTNGTAAPGPTTSPKPNAATTKPPTKAAPKPSGASKSRRAKPDRQLARRYLKTGAHRFGGGDHDSAVLLYTLAFDAAGKRPPAVLFKNLGLAHRALDNPEKLRACFNMYLAKKPSASDAERVRSLLAAQPATRNVACVSRADVRRAKKVAARMGARIDAWSEAAGAL